MNPRLSSRLARLLGLIALIAPAARPAAAESISLDFSQANVLPSATGQGLSFEGSSGVTEGSVFSVANGLLHVDTMTTYPGRDVEAGYILSGYSPSYDSTLDAEMTFRTRVTASQSFGMFFGYSDAFASAIISVTPSSWSIYNGASGSLAGPPAFHTFDIKSTGVTHAYTLTIDGVIVSSGTLPGGFAGPSQLFFGDGTTSGGNITGDISSFSYSNPPSIVPEPASLAMLGIGLVAMTALGRRPRPRPAVFACRRAS